MLFDGLVFVDSSGYHFPDYPTILSLLETEYRGIYGADVVLDSDSQDGQWLAIQAKGFYDSFALGQSVYNAFSPATAQGVGLSSNVKINGIKRLIPSNSTADIVIVGQIGTVINSGQVQDILEQRWALPSTVVIPNTGTITVTATAVDPGAIAADPNTITKIYTPTRGWQTANNPTAAAPGAPVEDDAQLRERQTFSTALPSLSVFDGTLGAIKGITGVVDAFGYENDTDITDVNGIPPHSISMIAEGGDALEIATAIAVHKTPGTGTFGTTSETVYDQYGIPNIINFYRPTVVGITVEIRLTALFGYTTDFAELIKQSIADYINVLEIGSDVLYTKLYTPANLPGNPAGATFDILTIKIARDSDPVAEANVVVAFNEVAKCDTADITVVVVP